jgi:hypothetical protein
MAAAREMGDDEVCTALQTAVDERFEPTVVDGARRYVKASTQANAMLLLGRFSRAGGFHDLVNGRPGAPYGAGAGPVLAEAPYPDVLVAKATNDGAALDLVLRPGGAGGRSELVLERLRPGASYAVRGAAADTVTADGDGRARLEVDLDDRVEVTVSPSA